MEAAFTDLLAGASSVDAAELLVAELRERRKRLDQLIRLVQEQVSRDLQALEVPRPKRLRPAPRCRPVVRPAQMLANRSGNSL